MAFKVNRFLLQNYYTLYYFQELVVRYGVHFDRRRFRRIYETFPRYALHHYRALYPSKQHSKRYLDYPLTVQLPLHLRLQAAFFALYAVRCFAISCIRWATDSRAKRIILGTEFIAEKGQGFFIETTFLLWGAIAVLYFRFSLPRSLLDYKCLAVLRISPKRPEYLFPSALGLTRSQLLRLYRFRRLAALFLHSTMAAIPTFGPVTVVLLYLRTPLYSTHFYSSLFWTLVLVYWIYAMSALLYTNLIAFIVVAKYLALKQQSAVGSLETALTYLCCPAKARGPGAAATTALQLRNLLEGHTRYAHLQEELAEYGRFWRPYLTFIFVIYVLLAGFILFLLLLTSFFSLGKFTYGIVLYANGSILVAITYHGGRMVTRHEALAGNSASLLGRVGRLPVGLSAVQTLKISNLTTALKEISPSGFSLLNGYVIQYDTLRLLIVNIVMYFILIIKRF